MNGGVAGNGGGARATAVATTTLASLAVVGALFLGRELLVPVVMSLLLTAVLQPLVQRLRRRARLPAPAAAALVVAAAVLVLVGVGAALAPPLRTLATEVPKSVQKARERITRLAPPLQRLVGGTAGGPSRSAAAPRGAADRGGGAAPPDSVPRPPEVTPSALAGVLGRVFGTTTSLLTALVEVTLLSFFVLAAGDAWRKRVDAVIASPTARRRTLDATREMRAAVARYLLVTAAINLGQAALVAGVVWLVGLPSPALWGALTFVAEFVPYLGGLAMIVLLLVVGLATLDSVGRALLAPIAYLVITTLQNNLVSPLAYGRGLRLNPTAILVGVMFWWAMWGVAGAFVAVPILASLRILSRHVPPLAPVGPFLEE